MGAYQLEWLRYAFCSCHISFKPQSCNTSVLLNFTFQAISYLGLVDSFDAIYGSSAGAVVGAYLVAGQFPLNAPAIYYNTLTTRSKSFLDKKNLIRSTGFGFLDFRPRALINMILKREKFGPPVLNLDFVCEEVMRSLHPLNWTEFWNKQSILPLHVIASGLYSEKSITLSAQAGNFQSLEELAQCIKASMALPGITGQPVQLLVCFFLSLFFSPFFIRLYYDMVLNI